jgi:three-Cys-motif partner protein
MPANIKYLPSADHSVWKGKRAASDGLPIRESGSWIDTKHKLLTHYAGIFSSGMKRKWNNRIYLELFSGPGRCLIRTTGEEELGSPLKVIGQEFTRFIFTEISVPAAEALAARVRSFPNAPMVEIWCGDCADVVKQLVVPPDALTFAFIDPTGIDHAPFSLIEALRRKTPRCDLLINIQHGMGIKLNLHQYTPSANEQSALTRFLGNDSWKTLPRHNAQEFFRGVLDIYKRQLRQLGFGFVGNAVLIRSDKKNLPLYLLLYASQHPRGEEFWEKARRGVLEPEFDLG